MQPTNKRLYVRMNSCHPLHQKMSIAYSQCLCLRRIYTTTDTYLTHADKLRTAMIKRGYSASLIDKTIETVRNLNRNNLLTTKPNSTNRRETDKKKIFCVITYHPGALDIRKTIEKHTSDLNVEIIISLKKDKNLRDILVKACIAMKEPINQTEHNLNIQDAEIDIDRNYCVNCHPLSNGRAILSKSPETKMGYRSVQNCKQMHNKYAIYCHI